MADGADRDATFPCVKKIEKPSQDLPSKRYFLETYGCQNTAFVPQVHGLSFLPPGEPLHRLSVGLFETRPM
jgi:hypothetical protein